MIAVEERLLFRLDNTGQWKGGMGHSLRSVAALLYQSVQTMQAFLAVHGTLKAPTPARRRFRRGSRGTPLRPAGGGVPFRSGRAQHSISPGGSLLSTHRLAGWLAPSVASSQQTASLEFSGLPPKLLPH